MGTGNNARNQRDRCWRLTGALALPFRTGRRSVSGEVAPAAAGVRRPGKRRPPDRAAAMSVLERAVAAAPDGRELPVVPGSARGVRSGKLRVKRASASLRFGGRTDERRRGDAATAALSAYHAKGWVTADRHSARGARAFEADQRRPGGSALLPGPHIWKARSAGPGAAAERYSRCRRSERYWESRSYAQWPTRLAQDKQTLQAVAHLRALEPGNALERLSLAQTESALWRDAGENVKAFEALDATLVVDRKMLTCSMKSAMLAERIDEWTRAEKRLRRLHCN